MLLCKRHAQVVADEVVPGLQHWGGDEIQNARGQTEELGEQLGVGWVPHAIKKMVKLSEAVGDIKMAF